jgi:DNA polymerase-3 subunit gamma/tau
MSTLYRKYRPQKFSELVGQNHIKITLQNEIRMGKLAHAFIFAGPRGIGKTTTARLLAKTINCLNNKDEPTEPCNACFACQEITNTIAFDVIEIDAASHTGVDNVRENIITTAKISPARLKYRVFIIDEVHMLSGAAFNALLKILEEPPPNVVFILATTEIHKVPATIISRCQRFDFKKISPKEIVVLLASIAEKEKIKIDKKVLENIARISGGSIRDAESVLGQILALGEREVGLEEADLILPRSDFNLILELLKYLAKKEAPAAIGFMNKIVFEGINLNQFTGDLIEILRKTLLQKIGGNLEQFTLQLDETLEKEIIDLNQTLTLTDIIMMIEIFSRRKLEIKSSEIIQLPLELAVIEITEKIGKT